MAVAALEVRDVSRRWVFAGAREEMLTEEEACNETGV